MYKTCCKRGIDIFISALLLLILTPALLIISLLITLTSRGPVFFTQQRVGKNFEVFCLYKFRTMTDRKHEVKSVIGRAEGVTWIGFYLRRLKIDELPQLFNVLKGEMSLVGPRPSVPEQLGDMSERSRKRYLVRPGMTGLAQVSGNIHLEWEERYKYDLMYIKNISFINDFKIILRTIRLIFVGEEEFIRNPPKLIITDED